MGIQFYLLAAVVFGPPVYQFIYFKENDTITRGKAFLYGLGYWSLLVCTLFMPLLFASQYGTVATVITAVFAIAATIGSFRLVYKKRRETLADDYAVDRFIVIKEMIACIGMLFGSILIFYGIVLAVFLPGRSRRN